MMKIIYAGTPDFAVPALESLVKSEHEVIAVYTQPDRPAGRGRKLQQSPVKLFALSHDIPVFQPNSLKEVSESALLSELGADLMVVAAYGLLLPLSVLSAPKLGCINIHGSLLPRWRGAAPIQRSILADDAVTGITIMQMDEGLDTGDMLSTRSLEIAPDWTSFDLHEQLKQLGADLLMETLPGIETGQVQPVRQDESKANYAAKLIKSESRVDWHKSAVQISREVRAFIPWPVSHTLLDNKLVRIWQVRVDVTSSTGKPGDIVDHNREGVYVSCGESVLRIDELQFEGKNRCTAAQALNGRNLTGSCFS
ncbi:MAG: methionyl-tRNA formyltransferase [Gammaproteobacteria bacterium]|jgi:methionyl-tRNA formyltransferase